MDRDLLAVSVQDLIWGAGLFEGEGTITLGIRNSDETYRLIALVVNTDIQVVQFFHHRWGGWFQSVYGERPGRKPAWTWTVAGPRAERFVRDMLPHLRTDRVRAKAELALKFRAVQAAQGVRRAGSKEQQREIYLAMRELNRRGLRKAGLVEEEGKTVGASEYLMNPTAVA